MFTYLSVTAAHHLSNLELKKVHEGGFGEVFEGICSCQVWDQTPLLKSAHSKQYIISCKVIPFITFFSMKPPYFYLQKKLSSQQHAYGHLGLHTLLPHYRRLFSELQR